MKSNRFWQGIKFAKIGVTGAVLNTINQELGRRYMVQELSRLPGLGSKMGQILALKFGRHQWLESAPVPVPLEWIKSEIEQKAPKLSAELDEIEGSAAMASLGQVHRAKLKSGQVVAIKVRYPQVDEQVEDQLELVLLGMRNIPKLVSRTLDIESYSAFLREFFSEEVDYLHEARSQIQFGRIWAGSSIIVPRVFEELSTSSILVQEFEESMPLDEIKKLSVGERTHCGALLSEFFGKGLLQNGWVHTDLHPKNWGYRPESRDLVVYDYGATFKLEPSVIAVMNELARGVHASPEQALEAFQKVGFKRAALWEIREKLPELAYRLFEPLHEITGVDYTHWSIGEDAERLLGNKKWAFRAAGPPWFLMIIRGFTGWLHGMHELEVRLSLRHLIGESHWGPEWAKIKENDPLPKVSGPITANPSTHLKVRVMDGTTEIVALEFPSLTVESLEDLIPDEILVQLRADGLDLAGIRQRAISTGLSPQLLFEKKLGTKTCRVWIE